MMAFDGNIQVLGHFHLARTRLAAAIAGNSDELDARGRLYGSRKVGQKHEGAFQDGDEIDGPVGKIGADLLTHFLDALLDLASGEEDARNQGHRLVGVLKASTSETDVDLGG